MLFEALWVRAIDFVLAPTNVMLVPLAAFVLEKMTQVLFGKVHLSAAACVMHLVEVAQMIVEASRGVTVRFKSAVADIGPRRFASTRLDVIGMFIRTRTFTTSTGASDVPVFVFQVSFQVL